MKYDGKWFGDHLGQLKENDFKNEVDGTFAGDPNKGKKIAELFTLFQIRNNGNNSSTTPDIRKP